MTAQVRNLSEQREYLKAKDYYQERIAWANAKSEGAKVNYYVQVLAALKKSHHDFVTGELELSEESAYLIPDSADKNDPIEILLFAISMLEGKPIPDSGDSYSI